MGAGMLFLMAVLAVLLLVTALRPIGRRFNLYDVPAGRKNHHQPVLVIGGMAMLLAFYMLTPMLDALAVPVHFLLFALFVIGCAGMIDDMHHLSSRWLFAAQITAALLIIVPGGVAVQGLGDLLGLGEIHTGPLAILFTLICMLGVINAINMVDGMDGLAGSLLFVSAGWFCVLAYISNSILLYELLLIMLGAIAGFLVFNMRFPWQPRASIFMGNTGSMSLGLLLAWFAVELCGKHNSPVSAITGVWVIGLPLIDMARVMLARIRLGKSAFVADHMHIHHLLLALGFSVPRVVVIKASISFVLGAIGVLGWVFKVPDYHMFYGFLLMMALYFYFTSNGWRHVSSLASGHVQT